LSKACHRITTPEFQRKPNCEQFIKCFFGVRVYLLSFLVEGLGRYTNLLCQNGLSLVKVKNRTKFENKQAGRDSYSVKETWYVSQDN